MAAFYVAWGLCAAAIADSSVDLSPSDPASAQVYADLDTLASFGLLPTMIVGQRPYSREEVARLVLEAGRSLASKESEIPEKTKTRLRALTKDLEGKLKDEIDS